MNTQPYFPTIQPPIPLALAGGATTSGACQAGATYDKHLYTNQSGLFSLCGTGPLTDYVFVQRV